MTHSAKHTLIPRTWLNKQMALVANQMGVNAENKETFLSISRPTQCVGGSKWSQSKADGLKNVSKFEIFAFFGKKFQRFIPWVVCCCC